jgi:predicted nucleic acid-binding protein
MSTAALEEVWYIEARGKAGPLDGLTEQAYAIFRPLLPVTDEAFRLAMTLDAPQLGPNDRIHAATCSIHGVETIASADSGFDRLRALRRIDPLDPRAVRRLLARERR